jgi:hypothetical protein
MSKAPTGNLYPRVNESTVTTTARVPNGHSLLIGGFYEEISSDKSNKVPVLGDLPAVNLLFKSTDKEKEHTSLVFIVTPNSIVPTSRWKAISSSHEIHESHILPSNHDYPDPERPGLQPPLEPSQHVELTPSTGTSPTLPSKSPQSRSSLQPPGVPARPRQGLQTKRTQFAQGESPEVTVRGRSPKAARTADSFGKMFGGHKKSKAP